MVASIALLFVKASALLAAALLAARLMTRVAAARRHLLWSGAFCSLMLLPALAVIMPPIEVEVSAAVAPRPQPDVWQSAAATTEWRELKSNSPARSAAQPPAIAAGRTWSLPSVRDGLLGLWIAGVLAALGVLALSMIRVRRLAAAGRALDEPEWRAAVTEIARGLRFSSPVRLLVADGVVTPMAAGIVKPTVFLPIESRTWSPEHRDMVLAHEIAHLASRDPLRHLLTRVAMSFYWFHPLAWLAAREATSACEQACDEAVLSLGVRPSAYAQVLLDFACGAPVGAPAVALPIVRRNLLETRLMAILDSSPRRAAGRRAIAPALLGAALTLCIAAIRPATPTLPMESPAPPATLESPVITASPAMISSTATTPVAQIQTSRQTTPTTSVVECDRAGWGGEFTGSMTSSRNGVVDRVISKRYTDLRVCAAAEATPRADSRPSDWSGRAERMILETEERGGDLRRMEINRGVTTYSINGRPAPIDATAQEWRAGLVGLLDALWEVNQLHGQVNSLQGEINSIQGERNSLQGEINSFQGEVNSMQGEINSVRGEENSMRGEINSISGHLNSLQGQINSEQGAINSLQGARNERYADRAAIDARIERHEQAIRRIQDEISRYDADRRIRDVERRIANFNPDAKVAEIERRIRNFDLEGKVADVRARIARLDVEGRVASIEADIQGLRAGDRTLDLERRADAALATLRARLRR